MVLETNILLTEEEAKLRDEIKDFVKSIDPNYMRAMEAEEIDYPKEALKEMAKEKSLDSDSQKVWRTRAKLGFRLPGM